MTNPSDRDPLSGRIGTMMGGFRIERVIGSGGMAAVYLGRREDGVARAVKVLHPQVARDRDLRARFAQELDAVSRLDHPSIVRVEDMGATPDGSPYMIMELLAGETLHARLNRGLPSMDEALALTDTLLDALAVAHAGSIIHRDVKPDNLFITESGLKILDFGIAKVSRESVAAINTKTGTALGTPSYMAQEQIKGVGVDHRADLFAVGAVLLKMLTGRRVHEEPDAEKRMLKMLTTPARPTLIVAPQLPEPLCRVIDRALAFEPHDRYPDARTMQADVRAVRAGQPPPYASSAPPLSTHGAVLAQVLASAPPPLRCGAPPTSHLQHAAPSAPAEPTAATRVETSTHGGMGVSPPRAKRSFALPIVIALSVLLGVLIVVLVSSL